MWYLWLKILHQFSIMAWFAGLWYLPRLFVYHAESTEPAVHKQLTIMMTRLFRYIMNPALLFVLISGLSLAALNWPVYAKSGWFHVKVTVVLLLILFHGHCYWNIRQFQQQKNHISGFAFRVYNEAPTIALGVILSMVILKPF